MQSLMKLYNDLEKTIPNFEKINTGISQASVGWHIEHTLLVLERVVGAVAKSNSEDYKKTFNLKRIIVSTIGSLPRGKGKAPAVAQPKDDITQQSLQNHFKKVNDILPKLNNLKAFQFFEHPYFGHLHLKATKRFLTIHTKHHLKIIHQIIG